MVKLLSSRANTNEVSGATSTVVDVVEKSAYKDETLTGLNVKLKKEGEDLTTAQNRKRKNDLTDQVDALEDGRDYGFKALSFTTKGLTFRFDETLATNAKLIYEVIKRPGLSLYNLPNLEQTAQMKSLNEELNRSKYKEALEITKLQVVFDEMNMLNGKYLAGVTNITESVSKIIDEDTKKVAEARKNVKDTLGAMIGYLNGIIVINESVELKQLCDSFSVIIDKANSVINARVKRSKNGKEDDETDELDDELENDI